MAQKIEEIEFKYLFNKLYNPSYCTGAFGGLTPRDEIVLNFFMERHPIPYSETRQVTSNGELGNIIKTKPNKNGKKVKVIRAVECGVIMDLRTAKEIRAWLDDQINELESITNKG